ncbi:conserved hypothetical protein [Theileria equi strain WA]|uniref:Uncharacterized protein n=1 Tax=Theileria equi strain WA TaxID=1537102 RepID=L1LEN6_THEEQ|nr:conserved hypothetical protein [Theileria equi strain WA]EKX73715.1 conserved hypothetical protein [Theileria equi strain WA]|eukprot:XP_004833167.1 conserved hypothetical protein [Theileria equi strain WA]
MLVKRGFSFIGVKRGGKVPDVNIFATNGPEISQRIRIASKKGIKNIQFWNLAKRRFQSLYKSLDAKNLSHIANGFARAEVYDDSIWDSIVARTYEVSNKLDDQDIALLCNAMCKVKNIDNQVFAFLLTQLKNYDGNIRCKYGSMIIYSLGKVGFKDHGSIKKILRSLDSSISKTSLTSIALLINGMYHLGHINPRILNLAKDRVIHLLMENEASNKDTNITMRDIVTIHQGVSCLKFFKKEIFDVLFSYMVNNITTLIPTEMVIIANSMHKSKRHNNDLVKIMSNYILRNTNKFTVDMVTGYINGISFHGTQDDGLINL